MVSMKIRLVKCRVFDYYGVGEKGRDAQVYTVCATVGDVDSDWRLGGFLSPNLPGDILR